MRKLLFLGLGLLSLVSCKENTSEKASEADLAAHYESFGAKLKKEGFKNPKEMEELYSGLKKGDTVEVKFQAPVNSVCKMKGCWMVLDLPGEEDPRVTFKDYGFFVPKDIEGREVIVSGKAFLKETSVEDQKHFAKDGGSSEEEIAAITEVSTQPAFIADGVLLKK
ncbi:MAG: DUF4920 domain-containing protein [Christiangramia sp.]|uniref:DUF4920 domain-containing protein n=1 Tax=Christiangramia sp. TaxID=1931228 RepID=UPI003242E28F